jgi:ribosomal-protein-alanine N-acetyltransferase
METNKKITSVFRKFPVLESERLILRRLYKKDAKDIFEFAKDPEMTKYVVWDYHKTIDDTYNFLNTAFDSYKKGDVAPWAIVSKEDMKVIGTIDYHWWNTKYNLAEMGYALGKNYWNKGYTTEAVREIIKFGFDRMQLNRIQAKCEIDNVASEKVMLKCGMKYEGTARKQVFAKNRYRSLKMYAILKEDFEEL